MATPVTVKLTCPLTGTVFQARTMGSSYYISGIDTDLRETGSIEEVRRYCVATCAKSLYSDYAWNFLAPDELDEAELAALDKALKGDPKRPRGSQPIDDFERFRLAATCFRARKLDASSLAELALTAYYVSRDLGRRDLEPELRDEAAALFEQALAEEDLPAPLRLRYAYLAGELNRRSGRREAALQAFDVAIAASREAADDEDHDEQDAPAQDVGRLARRMQATLLHQHAPAEQLLELTRGEDPDVASQARRLLARRRDRGSVEGTRKAWADAPGPDRTAMLQELVDDPPRELFDLLCQALEGEVPDDMRLAARALGALGDPRAAKELVKALERGVLSTEVALVEALRRIEAPGLDEQLLALLERWEVAAASTGDAEADAWRFTSDPVPLKTLLYGSGNSHGLELLIRDLKALRENDLWDKVPSGGPVTAAISLGKDATLILRGLLSAAHPAPRRWAAFALAEIGAKDAQSDLRRLVGDPDRVVRLQAACALARLGDRGHEKVVLAEIRKLGEDDLPFALHFLVPFKSEAVRELLLELLAAGTATPGELLPLLGRQAPSDQVSSLLRASLLETNDDTRAGAVTGLAFQGGTDVAAQLRSLYDAEESDEVRRRIVFGVGHLARQGHDRELAVRFLRERLHRGVPRLRFAIALTLLGLDDPSGVDIVRERAALFDESHDRYDLVAPAIKTLAQWDARSLPAAAAASR